ncbi:MAPEG family protein [Paenalcaligenes suwonensis]|uniref:MAPEG family protein n=1 Tax=Paenalcaligenes suwonensis TaxID=1202713 RepID=UPI00140815E9|nr:MAPEG family protein [Paenalcaligenes suwonensis]NHC61929.1 hypothetical protein [Paenalcaligenes suwonensis]
MSAKWILIIAAFLPFLAAVSAKVGGKGFQNHTPREWLAKQEGWRARANAAQANTFEALPFFFAAFLYALFQPVVPELVMKLGWAWVILRVAYIYLYIRDLSSLRSLIWFAAFGVNISLLFV